MTISPEQFKQLRELSQLFEQGKAKPSHLQQLSELLNAINQKQPDTHHEQLTDLLPENLRAR